MASVLFTEGLQRAIAAGLEELGKGGAWPVLAGLSTETRASLAKDLTFALQRHNLPRLEGEAARKPPIPIVRPTTLAASPVGGVEEEDVPVVALHTPAPAAAAPATAAKAKAKTKGKGKVVASPKAVNIKDSRSIGVKMVTYLKNMGMTWPTDKAVEKAKKVEMVAWFNALPSQTFQGLKTPEQQAEYYLKNVYSADVEAVEEVTALMAGTSIGGSTSNAAAGGGGSKPPNVSMLTDEDMEELEALQSGFDKYAVIDYLNTMPFKEFQKKSVVEHMRDAWEGGAKELEEVVFNDITYFTDPTNKKVYNEHGEYLGILGVGKFVMI